MELSGAAAVFPGVVSLGGVGCWVDGLEGLVPEPPGCCAIATAPANSTAATREHLCLTT